MSAFQKFVSIPYGKGKVKKTVIIQLNLLVSIPYGKGKVGLQSKKNNEFYVSIPYGKGKEEDQRG